MEPWLDKLEIDYLRRYLKETIDTCEVSECEEDDQDYYNTEDSDFFGVNTPLFPQEYLELIGNYRKLVTEQRVKFDGIGEKICYYLCQSKIKKAETYSK